MEPTPTQPSSEQPKKPRNSGRRLLRVTIGAAIGLVLIAALVHGLRSPAAPSASSETSDDKTWTCSMHPQIRQPEFGLCPICEMDLIPLQKSAEDTGIRQLSISNESAALLDIRVTPVEARPATRNISLLGRLEPSERTLRNITARMPGRIERLFVDFTGAEVQAGAHLAEIYSPELFIAQRELIEAARPPAGSSPSQALRDSRRRLLESVRERLRLLQFPEDQIRALEQRDTPKPILEVLAPENGTVVEKLVHPGDYVETGETLLRVADLSSLWLILDAYESDLPWLAYGQRVTFTVDTLPGDTFSGTVSFIEPRIDPRERVARVRVVVDNDDRRLKPGTFAKAEVLARIDHTGQVRVPDLAGKWISPMHPEILADGPGSCDICGMDLVPIEKVHPRLAGPPRRDPLTVPSSAVLRTGERALVYVRLPEPQEPSFQGRVVVPGPVAGQHTTILQGLEAGELVVSRGAFKLDSELQIKGKPSLMSSDAGLTEHPAGEGPQNLRGQWPPVLRGLHRLRAAVDSGDLARARSDLRFIRHAIDHITADQLSPEDKNLWHEFENRLLADLTLAEQKIDRQPLAAFGITRRSIDRAGRYLGLSVAPVQPPPVDSPAADALRQILPTYFDVVTALADDDPEKAADEALALRQAVTTATLPEQDRESLQSAAEDLASSEAALDPQRRALEPLSTTLIAIATRLATDQLGDLHVIQCPMVGEGSAEWLWPAPEIRNPYHGASMITCGHILDTLSLQPPPSP